MTLNLYGIGYVIYGGDSLFAMTRHQSELNRQIGQTCFTRFKSCDYTLGKFQCYTSFWIHGTNFHGLKYVKENQQMFYAETDHLA